MSILFLVDRTRLTLAFFCFPDDKDKVICEQSSMTRTTFTILVAFVCGVAAAAPLVTFYGKSGTESVGVVDFPEFS